MIVVTTPTGQIGQHVLDALLEAGRPVRVVVRDPERLSAHARKTAEIIVGTHDDPDVVSAAFDQADTVFWVVPPDPGAKDVTDHYLDFTRPASRAVAAQRVRRVVAVSSLGRGWPTHAGQLSAAFAMDDLLESTGVNYRALRMPFFRENLLHQIDSIANDGIMSVLNRPDRPLRTVSTADIAVTATGLLLDGSWEGQDSVDVISTPELSPNAMADVMTDVLGRPIRVEQIDPAAYTQQMTSYGMSPAWAQGLIEMAAAQDNGIYDNVNSDAEVGTTFVQWCTSTLAPAIRRHQPR